MARRSAGRLSGRRGARGSATALRRRTGRTPEPQGVGSHIPGEELIPIIAAFEQQHFRGSDYLHISDLLYKCIRKIAMAETRSQPMPLEPLYPSQSLTFAIGHAVGDYLVHRVKQNAPEQLYGLWKCWCETTVHEGTFNEAECMTCPHCGGKLINYHEKKLISDEYRCVGSVDMVLRDENFRLTLIELKSMAGNQWDVLEAPVPEHKAQILIYWWLARYLGLAINDKVTIVYANKQYMMGSPYKEFVLQPSLEMSYIEDYLSDLEAWKVYKETGTFPPRITCPSISAPQAKKCHLSVACFHDSD